MIWKAIFDVVSPTWHAYGRVAFVEADDEAQAKLAAAAIAAPEYPEGEIRVVAVGQSTEVARAAFEKRKAEAAEWHRRTHEKCPVCHKPW